MLSQHEWVPPEANQYLCVPNIRLFSSLFLHKVPFLPFFFLPQFPSRTGQHKAWVGIGMPRDPQLSSPETRPSADRKWS